MILARLDLEWGTWVQVRTFCAPETAQELCIEEGVATQLAELRAGRCPAKGKADIWVN